MTVLDQLAKALELGGNTHTIHDLEEAIAEGRCKLWMGQNCILLTEIEVYPRKRVLNVWLAAGDLDEILGLGEAVYAYGRDQGCEYARLLGRKGWQKPLAEMGWQPALTEFRKEL